MRAWAYPRAVLGLALLLAAMGSACGGGDDADDRALVPSTETAGTGPAATPAASPSGSPSGAAAAARGPAEHEGERTLDHIRQLSNGIGPRVSGTEGEAQAVEYIAAQFRQSGYDVELFNFEIDGFGFANVTLAGDSGPVAAVSLSGSAEGTVTGPLVYVGLADERGIAGRDLRGTVALADRGTLRFGEKYDNVRAAGAAALLVVNSAPGLFSGNLGKDAEFPVVGAGNEDADRLRAAAESGATITLEALTSGGGTDVIARPGKGARCDVVVGGHHDTVPGVPGATDNASGTAHTLELARAFAADGLDEGLCFVTFGGEEEGLFGSRALVERWEAEGALPEYMVNLDVTATGSSLELIGDEELQDLAGSFAARLGVPFQASVEPANTGSDHMSFRQAGVEVIFIAADDYSMIHTPADTIERVNQRLVEELGDVAYMVIADLIQRVAASEAGS